MASYEGYCVKCREKREFEGEEVEMANGRRAAKGKCPDLRHRDEQDPGQEGLTLAVSGVSGRSQPGLAATVRPRGRVRS